MNDLRTELLKIWDDLRVSELEQAHKHRLAGNHVLAEMFEDCAASTARYREMLARRKA